MTTIRTGEQGTKERGAIKEPITSAEYGAFQDAYDYLNAVLFGSSLPYVLVTLQRHAKARG